MLVEIAANDLTALDEAITATTLRNLVLEKIERGVSQRRYGRPSHGDVSEVLNHERLADRAELQNFRNVAERSNPIRSVP